jgi:hypothetical protein
VPIKLGFKYHFNNLVYAEVQAGADLDLQTDRGTSLVYSPVIGFDIDKNTDLGIRYEAISDEQKIKQVGLRLAYRF